MVVCDPGFQNFEKHLYNTDKFWDNSNFLLHICNPGTEDCKDSERDIQRKTIPTILLMFQMLTEPTI